MLSDKVEDVDFSLNKLVISAHSCFITFFGLRVCDLQVAVPGSELLPAHDLPLQLIQRDVHAIKNHRVVVESGGEFIMNVRHDEKKKKTPSVQS